MTEWVALVRNAQNVEKLFELIVSAA
jgi:hypothetical protein